MRKTLLIISPLFFLLACNQDLVSPLTGPSPSSSATSGGPGGASFAAANAATGATYHFPNVTEEVDFSNDCIGDASAILTYDAVIHETVNGNSYHWILQMHGFNTVTLRDATLPLYSGHFAEVQTLQLNLINRVRSFVVTSGSPSMQFHITFHAVRTASGASLSVFNVAC